MIPLLTIFVSIDNFRFFSHSDFFDIYMVNLTAFDELIPNMYILMVFGLNLEELGLILDF